jgi:hypothetical protein
MRKEKTTVRIFPDKIVFGNLVIMRFSVHLCQRKFLAKSYAPRFCDVRTSSVSLHLDMVKSGYSRQEDPFRRDPLTSKNRRVQI